MATLFQRNKKIVLIRDEFCGICGKYVNKELKTPHSMSAEVDHIVPKSQGGSDNLDNLQLSHRKCNLAKSDNLNYVHKEKKVKSLWEQIVIF